MTLDIAKSEKGMDIAGSYDLTLLQSPDIDEETGFITKLEFAVGQVYEPAAGINGGAVSPWFENATDAYAWCADNEAFLAGMFGDEPEPVREAHCAYCDKVVPSITGLLFMGRRDVGSWDIYDCGCRGS